MILINYNLKIKNINIHSPNSNKLLDKLNNNDTLNRKKLFLINYYENIEINLIDIHSSRNIHFKIHFIYRKTINYNYRLYKRNRIKI